MSTLQQIKAYDKAISVTDLRKNLNDVYEKLEKNHEVVITKKQNVLGVLVDKETYEKKEELIKQLSEKLEYYEIAEKVKKAEENDQRYTDAEVRKKFNL